jgi:hypothetical protein
MTAAYRCVKVSRHTNLHFSDRRASTSLNPYLYATESIYEQVVHGGGEDCDGKLAKMRESLDKWQRTIEDMPTREYIKETLLRAPSERQSSFGRAAIALVCDGIESRVFLGMPSLNSK